jgi:hypothetical protein
MMKTIANLYLAGLNSAQIANALGISKRSVLRRRAALRRDKVILPPLGSTGKRLSGVRPQ